jgi:hypothetical protein
LILNNFHRCRVTSFDPAMYYSNSISPFKYLSIFFFASCLRNCRTLLIVDLSTPNSFAISDWVRPLLNMEISWIICFLSTWSGLISDIAVALGVIPDVSDGFLCKDEFILCNYSLVKVPLCISFWEPELSLHLYGKLFFME